MSWTAQFVLQMIRERNEARQHWEPFTWSDFFPQFFPSTSENWQSKFCDSSGKQGLECSTFWGCALQESADRLEARRVSKQGLTQLNSTIRRKKKVEGLGPNSQTTLRA